LDATAGRIDRITGNVGFLLQSEGENYVQTEPVPFGIDFFDLEEEVPGAAKGFSYEGDGLTYGDRAFWLRTFYLDVGPLGIAFPLCEVRPDHLDGGGDDGDGTDGEAHRVFLLAISGLRHGIVRRRGTP
jgi:hypothetical protein